MHKSVKERRSRMGVFSLPRLVSPWPRKRGTLHGYRVSVVAVLGWATVGLVFVGSRSLRQELA